MRRTMILLLAVACLGLAGRAARAAEPAAVDATALASLLDEWNQLDEQIRGVQQEQRKLEVVEDPSRYWWNPLRRASLENQTQHANELALDLQKLKQQQRGLKDSLAAASAAYIDAMLQKAPAPTAEERVWWEKADHWRMPLLLRLPDWRIYLPENIGQQPPELQQRRRDYLALKIKTWLITKTYLEKRLALHAQAPLQRIGDYQAWLAAVNAALEKAQAVQAGLAHPAKP